MATWYTFRTSIQMRICCIHSTGRVYSAGSLEGSVVSVTSGKGGHIYLSIQNEGRLKHAAVYEPTGDLRRVARLLDQGDVVRLYGGVRRGPKPEAKIEPKPEVKAEPKPEAKAETEPEEPKPENVSA